MVMIDARFEEASRESVWSVRAQVGDRRAALGGNCCVSLDRSSSLELVCVVRRSSGPIFGGKTVQNTPRSH